MRTEVECLDEFVRDSDDLTHRMSLINEDGEILAYQDFSYQDAEYPDPAYWSDVLEAERNLEDRVERELLADFYADPDNEVTR